MPESEALSREELIALVRDQAARLESQAVELDALRTEPERIKRPVSRNNGNSSMPPSTDDRPGRGRPVKPVKGSAKRKQTGDGRVHLSWLSDTDVEIVDERPQGTCDGCGTDLAEAFDAGVDQARQNTIKTLITLAAVVHFDEPTLRAGKAGIKPYVWGPATAPYTFLALGLRSGKQFPQLAHRPSRPRRGRADRYVVYDSPKKSFGSGVQHQLWCSHRLAIRGYTCAAVKHGRDATTVLRDARTGNPDTTRGTSGSSPLPRLTEPYPKAMSVRVRSP